ncbi:MAG: site-specific integrase, partial [Nitrospirota bacterium]
NKFETQIFKCSKLLVFVIFRKAITIEQTKNGERLGLPICDRLMKTLSELKKVQHIHSHFVFHNTDGTKINKMRINRAFKLACRKAGIDNFRWHDLRHDFASQLVQGGVDLFRVQKLLGHKDGRMTQRYAHLTPENLQSTVSVFDKSGYSER